MLTTTEPLKSALSTAGADDTSLAVPTDDTLRSGQRRVLDQVLTVKRSKSKHGRNGTMSARTLSPTSRQLQSMRTRSESRPMFVFRFFFQRERERNREERERERDVSSTSAHSDVLP